MSTTETAADPVLELARALIRRPSVTPDDAGCQALLARRLEALGFRIEHLRFGDVDNLWARWHCADSGPDTPVLVFAGHTDVVPTGDEQAWSRPPFSAEQDAHWLHGRGAADMKGSLAAMVVAVEDLLSSTDSLRADLAFLITSDEEGPARDGTLRVMETLAARGEQLSWCIVGEPSSGQQLGDVVRVGRRGSLNATLRVEGVQGHVAYPELARNPIHAVLEPLQQLCNRQWDAGNAYFPPTSFQVSNIQSGTGATNVIPGSCEVRFNFRFCTEQNAAGLQSQVAAVLDAAGLDYSIDWQLSGEPFLTAGGALVEAVQHAIREHCGIDPELSTGGGTSDGRFIAPHGVEVVELGPENSTIHQVDERVPVAHLLQLRRIYLDVARRLLQ